MKRIPTYDETGTGFASRYWVPPTDGVVPATYDSAGLTAAIATAAGSTGSVIVNQDVTCTANVVLTAGVTLFSTNGSTINLGTFFLQIGGTQRIIGLRFTGTGTSVVRFLTAGVSNLTLACCEFDATGICINDVGASGATLHQFNIIERNRFSGGYSYGVYAQRVADSSIRYNWMEGDTGTRNIIFTGGRRNRIRYNYINGGLTGVTNVTSTSTAGATQGATIQHQVVQGNVILNIEEEGIMFEVNPNISADIGIIDQFVVNSTLGTFDSSPRIVVPRVATFPTNNLIRLYLVFVTGALRGRHFAVTAQAVVVASTTISLTLTNSIMTSAEFASITNTDVVQVGYPQIDNIIDSNYLESDGETGISLYGNCFNNRVTNNICRYSTGQGIRVTSVSGVGPSSTDSANRNTTTSRMTAPTAFNEISNNLLFDNCILLRNLSYQTIASGNNVISTYYNTVANNANEVAPQFDLWEDDNNVVIDGSYVSDPAGAITNSTDLTQITEDGIPEGSTLLNAGTRTGNRRDRRGYQRPYVPSIGPFDYATFVAIPA